MVALGASRFCGFFEIARPGPSMEADEDGGGNSDKSLITLTGGEKNAASNPPWD